MYWSSYLAALLALSTYGLSSPLPLETGNAGVRQDIIHRTLTKRLLDIDKRAECSAEELQDQASEEDDDDEAAPTGDQAAGFGAEFESSAIRIMADSDCGLDDKNKAKGSLMGGRQGDGWSLTADLFGLGDEGHDAEYHIDGVNVKVGSGDAVAAAKAIAADVVQWNPQVDDPIDIEDNPCEWTVTEVNTIPAKWKFAPQLTIAMPFEAINDIIAKSLAGQDSPFLGRNRNPSWVTVTKDFFQSKPSGLDPDSIQDDTLGFLSMLVSYAKAAKEMDYLETLHDLLPIMPRTNFVGLLAQVSSKLGDVDLYDLVKVLACYQNGASEVDGEYCTGDVDSPTPNGKMDDQQFAVMKDETTGKSLKVSDWINGLQGDSASDQLADLDAFAGGSIGGFGNLVETIPDTSRRVPVFEFRRLTAIFAGDMESWTETVESAALDYYKQYSTAPSKKLKKRQASCSMSIPATTSSSLPPDTTSSASYSPVSTPAGSVRCSASGGPSVSEVCVCGEDIVLPALPTTDSNTGTVYSPCNEFTPSDSATSSTPPTTSNTNYWVYTSTDLYGEIVACQDTSTTEYGGYPETYCAGTSLTLYAPPSASATIATSTHVNVGTLTGEALYTSVSNALETLCPTPTGNTITSCSNDTAAVHGVDYWTGSDGQSAIQGAVEDGTLSIAVPISKYNSSELRVGLINTIAMAVNSSAQGSSCYTEETHCTSNRFNDCVSGVEYDFCNAPQLVQANYYPSKYETNEDPTNFYMTAELTYETDDGDDSSQGDFQCEEIAEEVVAGLAFLGPEFIVEDEAIAGAIGAVCEAVKDVTDE